MSFLGTVGVVAQQGNQSVATTAPTNVSIATSSSGNYDNSFSSDDNISSNYSLTFTDTTDQNNKVVLVAEGGDPGPYTLEYSLAGGASAYIKCYLRATGATSYAMSAVSLSSSLSNGCSLSGAGTGWGNDFTSQDGTGSSGIAYFSVVHGGGRGGVLIPADGDEFDISIVGSATNSVGTTNATTITATFEFRDDS